MLNKKETILSDQYKNNKDKHQHNKQQNSENNSRCHHSCEECQDQNPRKCLSCPHNSNRIKASYSCPCLQGYYDNGEKNCSPCHYSCQTCDQSDKAEKCTSCPLNANRDDSVFIEGYCNCLIGFYDVPNQKVCQPCHRSCQTCRNNSPVDCLSCPSEIITYRKDFSATNNTCPCDIGYYDDGQSQTCWPCHNSCESCFGPRSNQCLACRKNNNRVDQSKIDHTCPCQEQYMEINQETCFKCHYTCLTCGPSELECLTCHQKSNRVQIPINYKCPCQSTYYDDGVNQECQKCHYSCQTCSGPSKQNCTGCSMHNHRYDYSNTTSQCPCLPHYYDAHRPKCKACHFSCLICKGQLETDCLECDSKAFRYDDIEFDGTCPCLNGYYQVENEMICRPCHYSCRTCQGPGAFACTTCPIYTETFRNDNSFTSYMCPCDDGYEDDGQNKKCILSKKCHYTCETCKGPFINDCTSCNDENNRQDLSKTENMCPCLQGYFDLGLFMTCERCHYSCVTCNQAGPYGCQSCPEYAETHRNDYSISASCCPCDKGWEDSGDKICQRAKRIKEKAIADL